MKPTDAERAYLSDLARLAARRSRGARPRPQCRRTILRAGFKPVIYCGDLLWAITPDGRLTDLTNGMRNAMACLVSEGHFTDEELLGAWRTLRASERARAEGYRRKCEEDRPTR